MARPVKKLPEQWKKQLFTKNFRLLVLGQAIFTAILSLDGCGYNVGGSTDSEPAISEKYAPGDTEMDSDSREESREQELKQEVLRQEILRQEALTQAETIDFAIQESSVDMKKYDRQADRLYKEAFLKAVTNQIPIYGQGGKETYFYRDLLKKTGKLSEDQFLKEVRESDYFYQDFDGDGLPELTVDTEGPCVLKYHPEGDRVELLVQKEEDWHLLGTGQLYAEFEESDEEARTSLYCYEDREEKFCLKHILYWHWHREQEPYLVSFGEYRDMAVEEETAQKLLGDYFAAVKQAPHPMTFSALFGDEENCGYMPGEEIPVRYGLRDTDILPVNEESGKEWEAYRAMMEGDFSVVEGEDWVRLQADYEAELELNDGVCGWSYFLMDFNQDGVKELVIRLYPDGVNNIASFCWEDGRIRMWGSYGSADAHGYWVPLANGKVLTVYWYQNDKDWWVRRVDPNCRQIQEQYYYMRERREESDDEDGEPVSSKRFFDFEFRDYYHNGEHCGDLIGLTEEEWRQIEEAVNGLIIPEDVWKPCSVFTPRSDRPELPGVG